MGERRGDGRVSEGVRCVAEQRAPPPHRGIQGRAAGPPGAHVLVGGGAV